MCWIQNLMELATVDWVHITSNIRSDYQFLGVQQKKVWSFLLGFFVGAERSSDSKKKAIKRAQTSFLGHRKNC